MLTSLIVCLVLMAFLTGVLFGYAVATLRQNKGDPKEPLASCRKCGATARACHLFRCETCRCQCCRPCLEPLTTRFQVECCKACKWILETEKKFRPKASA